ncbi:aspartate aminotransferase family protein [Mesorhizobium sp.]|uniref:aspartate aminotransferase family protein n=1 Tax=Mesorhizobium sp. TaxID=1871066 RepID=UPI000FE5B465|nr:aspartate aminotransferase family protein [Mesorhizobium sp.]RWI16552.1 MAG: aspartate aminotransferase family protein [Mesorhizobium sp.]RWN07621.1 MAG: aspartate aminotransferase family protein [Mesorhizobium sp.]RWN12458.1 MAG: aspartate aminotransferase family protein [Mesorhizobium sp.]TIQ97669.1 MAG: aspartate aminotransferase family protein [Mesorhizobium sp.]
MLPSPAFSQDFPPAEFSAGLRSQGLFERARAVFPDGTTRITVDRDPLPRYVSRGEGAYLVDVDGRRLLDLNANFTTLIHGHGFEPVIAAVERELRKGSCFANPTEAEVELASLLCERVPRLERIRFVNTGTEAVMFAIKAARAFTGRPCIAKIEGAYHGAYDWVEVAQASTPQDWGPADRPASTAYYHGMPASVLEDVVVLRFNDAAGTRRLLEERAGDIAAVLIDPMPSRAGLVAPEPEFLSTLQETARKHGILIIGDEVLNLRQGYHGVSARYGLEPDLFALGKIIGGGFPIGAIGGLSEIMAVFDSSRGRPLLPQGGTFSANPISMVAGHSAMVSLDRDALAHLEVLGSDLRKRLNDVITRTGAPLSITGAASLFRIHPRPTPPRDFREAYHAPTQARISKELTRFFVSHDIILPGGAAACLSTPMGEREIDAIVGVFEAFLAAKSALLEEIA